MDLHKEFKNSRLFHEERIDKKSVDLLIGLAAGIAADGKVNQNEASFLKHWIDSNITHLEDPVINILYRRLSDMLQDGVLDEDESTELLSLLHQFTGISSPRPRVLASSTLPIDNPPPEISWAGRAFMFTGVMAYGPRKICEALVIEQGGAIGKSVSRKLDFLVIGVIGNEQWLHSSYGTKIKKATELRDNGAPIAIIDETYWQQCIFG